MLKPSSSSLDPLEEISEDLADLGLLVDQLYGLESVSDRASNVEYHDDLADRLVETFQGNIKSINAKRSQLAALIEDAKGIIDADQLLQQIEFLRKEYLSLKSAVRVAHRQKGGLSANLTSSDPEKNFLRTRRNNPGDVDGKQPGKSSPSCRTKSRACDAEL